MWYWHLSYAKQNHSYASCCNECDMQLDVIWRLHQLEEELKAERSAVNNLGNQCDELKKTNKNLKKQESKLLHTIIVFHMNASHLVIELMILLPVNQWSFRLVYFKYVARENMIILQVTIKGLVYLDFSNKWVGKKLTGRLMANYSQNVTD